MAEFKIVTWNTNKKRLPCSREQWNELTRIKPTLLVLSECKDPGECPDWITDVKYWPESGVAVAVANGTLGGPERSVDTDDFRACEWRNAAFDPILVVGVCISSSYLKRTLLGLSALKKSNWSGPVIIAGDLSINQAYEGPQFKAFESAINNLGIKSAWHTYNQVGFGGEPATHRNTTRDGVRIAKKRAFMIDYIFVSAHFEISGAGIDEMEDQVLIDGSRWRNSDHRALWAKVARRENR